jgi:hypothetical protein
MPGAYFNTTTTSPLLTASGCDVNCDVWFFAPNLYLWANREAAINDTAVTVIVDVSLNVTKTSTQMDTQMIQSYYESYYDNKVIYPDVVIGDDGNISLSEDGTAA